MKTMGNKNVDITEEEYKYYKYLVELFSAREQINGDIYFTDTFDTDENGLIILIRTDKSMPMAIMSFLNNLMINQRMVKFDILEKEVQLLRKELNILKEKTK